MILVAIAAVVLLGALALAIDWGYGLTQRRVMQTASDSAALGVGRYLATSVIEIEGSPAFSVTTGDAWCAAQRYVGANDTFRPTGATVTFRLQLGASDPIVWTDVAAPSACPATASEAVPSAVRYARVTTTITYHALVSGILGFPTTTAAASARAKIAGTGVPSVGPVWPMVRHYDPSDFDNPCPPGTCDPTAIEPMTFWSPNEDDMVYGNFKGLVDFSRYSSRQEGVAQLLTEWDESGSRFADPPTPLKVDRSGNCGGLWDTQGVEAPEHRKQCSIPNWFYYAFQAKPSLETPWMVEATAGQEPPTLLSNGRAVCSDADRPDPAPSCDDRTVGDWVETVFSDVGTNMSDNMKAMIRAQGFAGPYSDQVIPTGPNKGEPYGKALVVLVYLWDCGESFDGSAAPGQQWNLILPRNGTDCSQIPRTGNAPAPDRVHLFTVAPFTFYEGLVSSQAIQGYWGGGFGDPRDCTEWVDGEPMCDLNPLSNTAVLVGDD